MKLSNGFRLVPVVCLLAAATSYASFFNRYRNFGVGVIVGEPTGLSLEYLVTQNNGFIGAAAWSFSGDPSVHAHLDYVFHARDLVRIDRTDIPLYFGVGCRIKTENDARIGVRFPLGVQVQIGDSPLEAFIELAPILDLAPSSRFGLNAAAGLRFYMNAG